MVIKKLTFYLFLNWLWLLLVPTFLMSYVYYLSYIGNKQSSEMLFSIENYFLLYTFFSGVGVLIGIIIYGIVLFYILKSSKTDQQKKYLALICLLLIDFIGLFIIYTINFGSVLLPTIFIPIYIVTAISGFYFIKFPISKEVNNMETDINIIDIN